VNSTNGANGAIVALSTYTTTVPTSGGVNTANYQLTGDQTQTGNLAANTLRIVNGANDDELSLGIRELNLTSTNGVMGAFIYAGGFNDNYTISGTTGIIKAATGNNHLGVNVYTGTLTVNALFNTGSATTTKWGAGTLVIGSNNSALSGAHFVQEGTLRLANNGATGTTAGGIVVSNGAALELSNNVAIGAEALTLTGTGRSNAGALRNVASNTSSYAGAITIGTGGARINSDNGASLTLTGGMATSLYNNVTFGGAGNTTVSTTAITGLGSVIKDGAGTLTLASANTYSDTTTVSAGKLVVNNTTGSGTGTGAVNVGTSGTLGGSGIISGATTIAGNLNPGNSPGLLSFGSSLTLLESAVTTMEIDGLVRGTEYDAVNTAGLLTYAGDLILDFGTTFDSDQTFNLFDFGSNTGSFDSISLTGLYTGSLINDGFGIWNLTSDANGFTNSWVFNQSNGELGLTVAVIPEPKAALLGAIGMLLLLRRRR